MIGKIYYCKKMRALKTTGAITIIALFFYLNIDSLCWTLNLRFKPLLEGSQTLLPNHWTTRRLFRVWDVFDGWSNYNIGYKAFGSTDQLTEAPLKPKPEMIDLDIYSYFPYIRGEANRRLWMVTLRSNRERTQRYQARILSVIKRLYNERHPDKPIKQAFLYLYTWPKSPVGWDANIDKGNVVLEAAN
jgi:hypothetical protein